MNPNRDRIHDADGHTVPRSDLSAGTSTVRPPVRVVDPEVERDWNQTSRDWGRRAERTFARTGDSEFMGNVKRAVKEKPWLAAAAGFAALFLLGRARR